MIGEVLSERYRIDEEIGQGGMGTVYRGYDTILEREVAIKVLSKTGLGTEGRGELLSEAQTAARLNHPNIITIYDVGEEGPLTSSGQGLPFIVMEYVEGRSLHENRPGSLDETLEVMRQVCAGLEHAHSQGIIHRDLKPENVVRSEEGIAKLMDFGLARSVASRYTSEGMVVGTVFYLAPEQALGQEIDQRTDLYSLGVMLYELTTGELPFVDPDPIAVISQHLHAPVVPPRAKNDEISSVLNDLILKLMSKDPRDRPISVKEVREVLESAEIEQKDIGMVADLTLLDRIVRGRMVGRERELSQARQLWQNTKSGEGQLLLISGEPGIGKTRLTREIATQAEVSGGQVYMGECQAEGCAPYAPFAEITRRAMRKNGQNGRELPKQVLADLLELAPDLSTDYPGVEGNPKLGPEADQMRLFENVVRFYDILCQDAPLLVVLEDMHWADSGSLHMLEHLARRTRHKSVMLLGTYREVELDEALPFHETLVDLTRRRLGQRVKLERLDRDKTCDLLAVIFAEEVTPEFLEGIYKETEGNPFFIEEVCKALVESGQVWFENGEWQRAPDMADVTIPQGIKVAIQSRVSKLTEETQDVLLSAAVIGREFDYEILKEVTKEDEERLIDCLEEAIGKQLIEEVKGGGGEQFSFTHALIPGTLRESTSGLRRIRLHRQVAAAMVELQPENYECLAYHWGEAGDEEKGLGYTIQAAERARRAYANEDAVRLYSEALALLSDDDPKKFDLFSGRGKVYGVVGDREAQIADVEKMLAISIKSGDNTQRVDALLALTKIYLDFGTLKARKPAEEALNLAREIGDIGREGRALAHLGSLANCLADHEESRRYHERANECLIKAALPKELIENLSDLSLVLGFIGESSAALETAQEALELSEKLGDKLLEAITTRRLAIAYLSQYKYREALPLSETALKMFRGLGDTSGKIHSLNVLGIIKQHLNMVEEAESNLLEGLRIAEFFENDIGILYVGNCLRDLYDWNLGYYEKSMLMFEDQLNKARSRNNQSLSVLLQDEISYSLYFLGKHEQALIQDENIRDDYVKLVDEGLQAGFISFMGVLSAETKSFTKTHQYLDEAMDCCSGIKGPYTEVYVPLNYALAAVAEGEIPNLKRGLEMVKGVKVYSQEHNLVGQLGSALIIEACVHMALLEEAPNHASEALQCTKEALDTISIEHYIVYPEQYFFHHSRALRVNGKEQEADEYLQKAYDRVMMVAGNISDEDLKRSYLENVRDNRELLAEYKERFEA